MSSAIAPHLDAVATAARIARAAQRRRVNFVALALSLGGDGLRAALADLDPDRDGAPGSRRPLAVAVHRDDSAATGRHRRSCQRDLRFTHHGRAGHADRHADRRPGGRVSRGIRPEDSPRQGHALHQRHPAGGAVDHHRPVHLRRGRCHDEELFGLRGHPCPGTDRHSDCHSDHREHALLDPELVARGRLCVRHAEVARHHDDHAEGGDRRRHHRGVAGDRADRRRDGALALHRIVEPVLELDVSTGPWPACR